MFNLNIKKYERKKIVRNLYIFKLFNFYIENEK